MVSPGTGVLTSESSSASSFVTAERRSSSPGGSGGTDGRDGRGGGGGGKSKSKSKSNLGSAAAVPTCTAAGVPYDRTTTVGEFLWGNAKERVVLVIVRTLCAEIPRVESSFVYVYHLVS